MKFLLYAGFAVISGMILGGCEAPAKPSSTTRPHSSPTAAPTNTSETYQTGIASWYGGRWHGRLTANGERYNQNTMTAAHKKLPFNSLVKVTNLKNGKSCVVRINNRGPHIRGRVIDLSVAAAKSIDSYRSGLTRVKLEVLR